MKALIFDFETQGLDAATRATEVGAILYDVVDNKWSEMERLNQLMWEKDYPPQPAIIVEKTGITDQMLRVGGMTRLEVFEKMLLPMVEESEVMFAHNAQFDKMVLFNTAKLLALPVPDRHIICTRLNFPWDARHKCFQLSHLAYEEDIPHDRKKLHRADADCELVKALVEKYGFERVLAYSKAPSVLIKAKTKGPWEDGGIQKGIANKLKMSWERIDGEMVAPKHWVKKVKLSELESIKKIVRESESPFEIQTEGTNS